jgi:hypothetical protein
MNYLGLSRQEEASPPLPGASYLIKLHKYLSVNLPRLAPGRTPPPPSILQQSYTLLTLGLDPSSKPLPRSIVVPLTLGFLDPPTPRATPPKPVLLRLPPDRLLYLLLRWQSLGQALPHVGRTDEGIEPGVPVSARGARVDGRGKRGEGDVGSVKSWVGSMRSVSMGSFASTRASRIPGMGWFGRKDEVNEG